MSINKKNALEKISRFALSLVVISVILLDFVPGYGGFVQLSCVLLVCVFFFKSMTQAIKINVIHMALLGFLIYCYCAKDYRVDFWRSLGFSKETANGVLVVSLVSISLMGILDTRVKRDDFIKTIVNSCMLLSMYLAFIMRGNLLLGLHGERMHQFLQLYGINSNHVGAMIGAGFLFAVYVADTYKNKWYYFCAAVLLFFSFISGSRKVIIYIVVGIALYYFFRGGAIRFNINTIIRIVRTAIVAVVLLAALYYIIIENDYLYDLIGRRIEKMVVFFMQGDTDDGSLYVRNDMIEKGWEYFYRNPWFGNGLDSFGHFYSDILGRETYAHNNYIELLVSVGIVGTAIYYLKYAIVLIRLIFRGRGAQEGILAAVVISILCAEIASVTYYYKFYYLIFGVAAAAVMNENKKKKKE